MSGIIKVFWGDDGMFDLSFHDIDNYDMELILQQIAGQDTCRAFLDVMKDIKNDCYDANVGPCSDCVNEDDYDFYAQLDLLSQFLTVWVRDEDGDLVTVFDDDVHNGIHFDFPDEENDSVKIERLERRMDKLAEELENLKQR